jgi:hypothetical protein
MTDDNLREALQGMRQPQPGIVYIADVLAYVEPELERLSEERNRALDALTMGNRDLLLAQLTEAEADRDRARDIAVALEQENARPAGPLTDEDYNAAIEQLHLVYGPDAEPFISVIETVRDEEIFHEGPHQEFTDGCMGCLTWRIADAFTRAVNGGEAL